MLVAALGVTLQAQSPAASLTAPLLAKIAATEQQIVRLQGDYKTLLTTCQKGAAGPSSLTALPVALTPRLRVRGNPSNA